MLTDEDEERINSFKLSTASKPTKLALLTFMDILSGENPGWFVDAVTTIDEIDRQAQKGNLQAIALLKQLTTVAEFFRRVRAERERKNNS